MSVCDRCRPDAGSPASTLVLPPSDDPPAAPAAERASLVTAVYIPAALLSFGQGLLIATLPLYAAALGAPVELVSLAVGAAAIGTLLTDLPAGALLARMGLRPAMIGGSAIVAISAAALAIVTRFDALIVGRLLAGVGTSIWALSRHAYMAEAIPPARRGKAISVFGGINRLG
ncbi:MAG TPA: MFS transporter, partial [Thermomicrobiales bacterium]|nr:MFS transporter [Thermomicrobiales bacterium]